MPQNAGSSAAAFGADDARSARLRAVGGSDDAGIVIGVERVGIRARWLTRPLFVAAVAVLFVNDHVFKRAMPSWWSGKLSDLAGVAVVGVVAAVVVGRRKGIVITAAGFAALKVIPGVAEAVAPVLGGRTLRDASDLLALGVLVPLWWWLGRPVSRSSSRWGQADVEPLTWSRVQWSALGATTLPVLSVCVAMVVGTATSCGPSPAVIQVVTADGSVHALVSNGYSDPQWARSDDNGRTWSESEKPGAVKGGEDAASDPYGDATPLGPLESCAGGVCYRLEEQRRIERVVDSGAPVEVFALTEAEYSAISTGCGSNEQRGVLTSVAAINSGGTVTAIASLGAEGVVVGSTSGSWTRVDVLDARPPDPPPNQALSLAQLAFGPVIAAGILLTMRKRWPSWTAAIATTLGGWSSSMAIAGAARFFEFRRFELLLTGLLAVTLMMTIVVGRSRMFVRRDARHASKPGAWGPAPPASWFSDPTGRNEQRYWDGQQWTDDVATDGAPSTDPLTTE